MLARNVRHTEDVNEILIHAGGPLAGQTDIDTGVSVSALAPVVAACTVYFNRTIGDAGPVVGATVQDGTHN